MFPPTGSCPGCAYGLVYRYLLKAVGPNVIVTGIPGCGGSGRLEYDGKPIDTMGSAFGNAGSFASGISSALTAMGDTETIVMPVAGDGGTFDIGFGAVSAAAERNENMLYVCKDNEAYQNTGNQRSSASPWMSTNATNPSGFSKEERKKDVDGILAAHRIPYLATATVAFPEDLMNKVKKAKDIKGFRFIHVLSPCTTGWGFPADQTITLSRLAVETNVFPLYEVEDGVKYTLNYKPKGTPVTEYLKMQRRFRDMSTDGLSDFNKDIEERWDRLQFLTGYKESD